MNATRTGFDLQQEFRRAWDWLWADRLACLEKYGERFNSRWVSATDLVRRVRAAAYERLHGREYGSAGTDVWGSGVVIRTGSRMTLLALARRWLAERVRAGELRVDNPGREWCCSGARFRPVDAPLSATELAAREVPEEERRRRRRIIHLEADRQPWCTWKGPRPPCRVSWGRSRGPLLTENPTKVTCKRCLKLIGQPVALGKWRKFAKDTEAAEAAEGSE